MGEFDGHVRGWEGYIRSCVVRYWVLLVWGWGRVVKDRGERGNVAGGWVDY